MVVIIYKPGFVRDAFLGQLANWVIRSCHLFLDVVGQVAVNPLIEGGVLGHGSDAFRRVSLLRVPATHQ